MNRSISIFILTFIICCSGLFSQGTETVAAQEYDNPTLITIHAEDAYLPSILSILADESGYNIVTGANVNKQDQTWWFALWA